jgi:neuropeptide S receptor 1
MELTNEMERDLPEPVVTFKECYFIFPRNESGQCVSTSTPYIESGLEKIWTTDVIQRVSTLIFIMVIAIVGNVFIVILLTCSRYKARKSRVNLFIMNLAIGDLLICFITMTTEILFVVFGEWKLGAVACKLLTYLEIVTLASATFILTSMSIDRYLSLCHPVRFNSSVLAIVRAKQYISVSWVLAFIFASPQLLIFVQTVEKWLPDGRIKYSCSSSGYNAEWQRKLYFTFMTSYILVIPAFIISYCYIKVASCIWKKGRELANAENSGISNPSRIYTVISKAKIKTLKMTFVIIVTFITCWTPYFVSTLIQIYSNNTYEIPAPVIVFAETIALFQSALNPIIYGCFNFSIKKEMSKMFFTRKYTDKRCQAIQVGACGTLLLTRKLINKHIVKHEDVPNNRNHNECSPDKISGNKRSVDFTLKVRFRTKHSGSEDDNENRGLMTI